MSNSISMILKFPDAREILLFMGFTNLFRTTPSHCQKNSLYLIPMNLVKKIGVILFSLLFTGSLVQAQGVSAYASYPYSYMQLEQYGSDIEITNAPNYSIGIEVSKYMLLKSNWVLPMEPRNTPLVRITLGQPMKKECGIEVLLYSIYAPPQALHRFEKHGFNWDLESLF